jgi:hypothetical protein
MTNVPYTFGNEPSPIPLSQLDANFAVTPLFANTAGNVTNAVQANITAVGTLVELSVAGNIVTGNLNTNGTVAANAITATGGLTVAGVTTLGGDTSVIGNITAVALTTTGAIVTGNAFVAAGNITGNNVLTNGVLSATGNITGANISASGRISAVGDVRTNGNVIGQGLISATGNIVTNGFFVGAFQGSIVGNITGAPGSNTQVLFNTSGNVDAVGGLTYNKGSNTLTVLGTVNAQSDFIGSANLVLTQNASIGGNTTIGGNLVVGGGAQISGVVTGPTAPVGTANNQLATTVFVSNQINQYANAVAITGGTITVGSLVSNTSVSTGTLSASGNVTGALYNTATWTIREISGALFFQRSGVNIAKLDSSGNFTTIGNVTGFGTL